MYFVKNISFNYSFAMTLRDFLTHIGPDILSTLNKANYVFVYEMPNWRKARKVYCRKKSKIERDHIQCTCCPPISFNFT